jgi:hypothetical protein
VWRGVQGRAAKKQEALMRTLVLSVSLAGLVVVAAGCGQSESKQATDLSAKTAAPLVTSDLVGRWQFVFTDEVRNAYRARIMAKIQDPIELEKTLKLADEEAKASELEFTADGVFVSRVLADESRRPYEARVASSSSLMVSGGKKDQEIVFVDHDTISIYEPAKGHLIYTRVK